MKQAKLIKTMSYAAMCLALALILPFLTAQIPEIGQALSQCTYRRFSAASSAVRSGDS